VLILIPDTHHYTSEPNFGGAVATYIDLIVTMAGSDLEV